MGFAIEKNTVVLARLKGKVQSQLWLNLWAYSGTEEAAWGVLPTDSSQLATQLKDFWNLQIGPLLIDATTLETITVGRVVGYHIDRPFDPINPALSPFLDLQDEQAFAETGDVITQGLPSFVAVTLRKKTLFAGKKWRGSCRISGLPESATDNPPNGDYLTAPAHTAWDTAWDNVANTAFNSQPYPAPVANPMKMGIVSLKAMFEAVPPPAGVGPVNVTVPNPFNYFHRNNTTPVNLYVGSQVSRKVGHGS